MKKRAWLIVALPWLQAAQAADYTPDKTASRIEFSGTHAGNTFKGTFEKWDAAIRFDADRPSAGKIDVTIDTASAKTGNAMYDGTLPTSDWFDAKTYPQATFSSNSIARNADGSYTATGPLTLRGKTVPVTFAFTLSELAAPPVKTSFTLSLDRLAFGIGEKSDAKAEWVGRDIPLNVTLVAKPK